MLAAALAVAGCYAGSARDVSRHELSNQVGWVVVDGVPFVRQESDRDCGAAALAMLLARWGRLVKEGELVAALAPERGHGIAAGRLRDLARQKGLHAFLVAGDFRDLEREIGAQRPVLVGVVQRYGAKGIAHYEVVIGMNRAARRILTLDPARGLREDGFEGFAT